MRQLCVCVSVLLALATLAVARSKAGPEQKCKSGPVDLMFIIDSSRSVRPHEFETMRKFMIDIIHTLDVEANATRVGVVQYSSQVQNEFSLKTHGKLQGMVKGINEIIPLAQGTMTGLAIKYVMNHAFTAAEGDRPKVPNVAVIVTDGRPQDRVAEVAAEARDKGIEIYAVGVARADMTSLRAMASPPFEDHVFLVESFDLIYQFGLQFQDKLCGMDLCLESDHGCEHLCESSPGSFHCLCLPGYTLNEDGKTCKATMFEVDLTSDINKGSFLSPAIDLCAEGKHDCEQICIPSPGAFTCGCNTGYTLNDDKKTCTMIDYCSFGNHSCQHECVSVLNGYFCHCNEGYTLQEDGKTCQRFGLPETDFTCEVKDGSNEDCKKVINLCAEGKHDCEQICITSLGTFTCNCKTGYTLNDDKITCTMIDLCAEGKHECEQICIASPGAFTCDCNAGFKLNNDKITCTNLDLCNTVEHGCEHQCISTPGSYYCICPEGQLLAEDGKACRICRSANIDLVLLIDGSKSVRPQNFELVKQFVNQVVDSLDVSAHGTRVGLVQYSSHVRTEFALKMYEKADEIKKAVMNVEYMEKGTMTGLALKHMVENSFSEAEGARKNIPRVGLVFTDGRSQDDITEWAKKAKEAGITMYAVGVGKAVEDELREIVSEPLDKHFFYTTDFTFINQIAENLKLNVCAEESQGEIEVKDPCACESLVEFQQATMSTLEQLKTKLVGMTARLEDMENQLLSRK